MTVFSIIMAMTWLIAGLGVRIIGIKDEQGKLPLNVVFGIRIKKLMASEEAWIKGHKAAAGYLKLSSAPLIIGGIACLFADDSAIAVISIPVVILLLILTLLAAKKANAAIA